MFYSQSLLSRKGPLGNIWMAAYCFKQLKREQIACTDISSSIDKILPDVQIPYRVLAQLLLGIVKIFSKKVDFLYRDCNEALTTIIKTIVPSQLNVLKVAGTPCHKASKATVCTPKRNANVSKEDTPPSSIKVIRAASCDVTITVPEMFELDSFDLEVQEERDTTITKFNECIVEDAMGHERSSPSLLNECYYRQAAGHVDFNSACFTPATDVFPSLMMDIDLNINEIYKSSCSEAGDKFEEDFQHREERSYHEGLQARKSLDAAFSVSMEVGNEEFSEKVEETVRQNVRKNSPIDEQEISVEQIELQKAITSENGKTPEDTAPVDTHDKLNVVCDPGLASPKFTVTTPAKRERSKMPKKRKLHFDDAIVLSNESLRRAIHDASSLACKRRKVPHTYLDAWKANRIGSLQQGFTGPLVPFISSELKALFEDKVSSVSSREKSSDCLVEPANLQNEMPKKSLNKAPELERTTEIPAPGNSVSLQNEMPENPLSKAPENERSTEVPSPGTPDAYIASKAYEMHTKESSPDSELDAVDGEFDSHGVDGNDKEDGWSTRTRAVAQYLYRNFASVEGRERKKTLSLSSLLKRNTRTKCARFFYETLALKSYGCVEVRQDSPYCDIILSATHQLEAVVKKQ